jgi:hypothetical protein
MQKTARLDTKEIQLINEYNSKNKIISIFYYYWINTSNPDEHYSFIDVVEFVFNDNSSLFFKINEDDSGIAITNEFQFEKYKTSLQNEFLQQIRLQKVEATSLEIWKSAMTTNFLNITNISEGTGFLNVAFLIAFENEKIELFFHPVEGLVVAEFEETLE